MATDDRRAGPVDVGASNVSIVALSLRDDIVAGRLRCGDRIKEEPVAERLGVSRGAVRSAIQLVAGEGLLELRPNRGAVVPTPALSDVLEIYALRATLGSLALQRLHTESNRIDRRELRACLRSFRLAVDRADQAGAVKADLTFQDRLVGMSGLPRVEHTFRQLSQQLLMFITSLALEYDLESIYLDVERLSSAVATGDLVHADQLWREKFERCMSDFIEYLPPDGNDPALWAALTQPLS